MAIHLHHALKIGIYNLIDGTQTNWKDEYRFLKLDQIYAYVTDKGFVIRDD